MGKDTQSQNTHDRGGVISREFSSGGVVYKRVKERESGRVEVLWLVAASMPSELFPKVVWRLPKGWLDDSGPDTPGPMASGKVKAKEKDLQEAAVREVKEEGGIEARIIKKIGTNRFFYTHPVRGMILKFVTSYLMEWVRDLPEGFDGETSEIRWLKYQEAYETLSIQNEKETLKKANELLHKLAPVA